MSADMIFPFVLSCLPPLQFQARSMLWGKQVKRKAVQGSVQTNGFLFTPEAVLGEVLPYLGFPELDPLNYSPSQARTSSKFSCQMCVICGWRFQPKSGGLNDWAVVLTTVSYTTQSDVDNLPPSPFITTGINIVKILFLCRSQIDDDATGLYCSRMFDEPTLCSPQTTT